MIGPMTYSVRLETVDNLSANFEHHDPSGGPPLVSLSLARSQWEDLGRPGVLDVSLREPVR